MSDEHGESDVDDEGPADLSETRPPANNADDGGGRTSVVNGREGEETNLKEDPAGRDFLAQLHREQEEHPIPLKQGCEASIRRRKRTADQVTSSPSLEEDDNEDDLIDYGSPRHRGSEDGDFTPSGTPRPLEQTEIKIQRPLGLLAQHGITTKTSTAALQARAAHRPPSELESSKDRPHHPALGAGGLDFSSTPLSLMDRRFMPSPPAPPTPTLSCLDLGKPTAASPGAHHWTFEEQFKQVCAHFISFYFVTEFYIHLYLPFLAAQINKQTHKQRTIYTQKCILFIVCLFVCQ